MINKQLDYDRGFLEGLVFRNGRLGLAPGNGDVGTFFSRVFDSRESGTVWHRFLIDGGTQAGQGLALGFYSFETPELIVRGEKTTVSDLIRNPEIPVREKKRLLRPYLRLSAGGTCDMLLHEVTGRYLVVCAELHRREADNSIGDMCLFFPKETWMRFLPGVYSRDRATADFTERYLSIFQSVYDDREREIRESAGLIHPSAVSRALLEELAGWYDLKDLYLWTDEKLRQLVLKAPELLLKRGTAAGLKEYLGLYLGTQPEIREDEGDRYGFLVLVPEEYIDDIREQRSLMRIIGHMKPAGMDVRLAALERRSRSGEEMRLGVNSRLEGTKADGRDV